MTWFRHRRTWASTHNITYTEPRWKQQKIPKLNEGWRLWTFPPVPRPLPQHPDPPIFQIHLRIFDACGRKEANATTLVSAQPAKTTEMASDSSWGCPKTSTYIQRVIQKRSSMLVSKTLFSIALYDASMLLSVRPMRTSMGPSHAPDENLEQRWFTVSLSA